MIRIGRRTFILGASFTAVAAALLVYLFFGGEQKKGGSVGAAEAFLNAYYVSIDLEMAKWLTEGVARTKIDRQIEEIKKMSLVNKNRSKVSYRLLNERSLGDRKKAFSFELSIEPQGGKAFRRVVFLHLRRKDQNWRIHAFRERNP